MTALIHFLRMIRAVATLPHTLDMLHHRLACLEVDAAVRREELRDLTRVPSFVPPEWADRP
jgi:hypothetical protein